VLVRKHRNGPLGDVTLRYAAEFCRFEGTEERFGAGLSALRPVGGFRISKPGTDGKTRAAGDGESSGQ
jgi:hypothetical protein